MDNPTYEEILQFVVDTLPYEDAVRLHYKGRTLGEIAKEDLPTLEKLVQEGAEEKYLLHAAALVVYNHETGKQLPNHNESSKSAENPVTSIDKQKSSAPQEQVFNEKTPLEVILKNMTYEEAIKIKIPSGRYKGETMGTTAEDDISYVRWMIKSYHRRNNILRAAAIIICTQKKAEVST